MNFQKKEYTAIQAWAEVSTFSAGDVVEMHAMIHVEANGDNFVPQSERLLNAYAALLADYPKADVVMRRFFLSDISNQNQLLREQLKARSMDQGAISVIGQPPLDGSKIAMWVYMQQGTEVIVSENKTVTLHNGLKHTWESLWHSTEGDSANQTRAILEAYEQRLQQQNCTLPDNCLRTWFFIRDVDTHYKGMVQARCSNFLRNGLNARTHYIASTGIGGQPCERASLVQVDTYTAKGINNDQIQYLYAKTHLNPTYEYGVTFERGTAVQYGDRRHLIISGTASINNKGEVVHVGDISAQADRMIENVSALLAEGNGKLEDISHIIVYLRDYADYPVIRDVFNSRFPDTPYVITLAPVCRPEWLIEMECIAITTESDDRYAAF